ncbi:delta-aminolevulinic acid dehydratase [mine drainage metagenome]|uniref:Delta-aminolevulinic acid dehydratase n=1 Tax=mine drainage metagenome TaxID=410659 RepID=T1A042_9ZZZZ
MRRIRSHAFSRALVRENRLDADDLICPVFVTERSGQRDPIASMPGVERLSIDCLLRDVGIWLEAGIRTIALFPVVEPGLKTPDGSEAWNPKGLIPKAVRELKKHFPDLGIIADVALDPYTVHGHDGVLDERGRVLNDETVALLVRQSLCLADSGVDVVAPSDMMDGRVGAIRAALEKANHSEIQILAYAAKYASSFYGPFREAIGSSHALGLSDKTTYQMDPANRDEAIREVSLDIEEGADYVMVKPALPYLDVIFAVKSRFHVPTLAYQVSGEYAFLQAAIGNGWLPERESIEESLLCIKRAGADAILTYFAPRVAQWLR